MLNYKDYSEEEIRIFEEKAIESKNIHAEKLYLTKNEGQLRRAIFEELKIKVEEKTRKDEEMKCQGIFFNSLLREKNLRYPFQPGLIAPIYFGLFVTSKRVFLYKLSVNYELIDETEYINDIENIKYLKNSSDFSDTYEIAFNDKRKFQIRYFNKESENILILLASYLKEEKGIQLLEERVKPYEERFNNSKWFIVEWIYFGVLMIICLWVVFSRFF